LSTIDATSTTFARQLLAVIDAVTLHPPARFSWLGFLSEVPVGLELDPETARAYLRASLADRLYVDFYCAGFPRPTGQVPAGRMLDRDDRFVEALSAANGGAGPWEPGWRLIAEDGRRWIAERDGLALAVPGERLRSATGDGLRSGVEADVRLPKELRRMSPGYYMLLGDVPLDPRVNQLVRVYWHLTEELAVAFVAAASTVLNRARLAFRLKVLDRGDAYRRCDAAILYAYKSDFSRAHDALRELHLQFAGLLPAIVPPFTKQLAAGIALAEDPGGGASFGEHRCSLLADALIRASEQGAGDAEGYATIIRAHFVEAGVDLDAPFLAEGSSDIYDRLDA
jgi:hypothetical protein